LGSAFTPDSGNERPARRDSVHQVTLIGLSVAASEMRQTASGIHVTIRRVATNDADGVDLHDVVL
jgi:hypothetical protein